MDKRLIRALIAAWGVIVIVNGSIGGGLIAYGLLKTIAGMPVGIPECFGFVVFLLTAIVAANVYFSEDKKD